MPIDERRRENRITLQIPFEFRPSSSPRDPIRKAVTQNISPRGVGFTTDYPFLVGGEAEVTLEFPRAITGRDPSPMRCKARVMHVKPAENGTGNAVGMFFEKMESARLYRAPAVMARPGAAGAI